MIASGRWRSAATIGSAALLTYLVLVGGTTWGELSPWARVLNTLVGGGFILVYILRIREADRVDRLILLGVVAFSLAGVLSDYPRQSLDAVLAALAYAAGLFVARGLLAWQAPRRAVIVTMMGLSLLLTLLTASRWTVFIEWWQLTGWTITPPLNMELDATPWGHRHDLALLLTMLYPAWWVDGRRGALRTVLGIMVGLLTAFVIVVDGSRTLWLAIVVATATLGVPRLVGLVRSSPAVRGGIGFAVVAILAVAMLAGPVPAVVERALAFDTLVARAEMWAPLLSVWQADPVGGLGPASFPFALQHTSYFDAHAWAPRHPDNVVVQLLVETGLLGIAAVALVVLAVAPPLLRSSAHGARWGLVAFAVAGIGANPTEFAFLVIPVIAWCSYALPRPMADRPRLEWPSSPAVASLLAFSVVSAASAAGSAGAFAHESARSAAADGDLSGAAEHLATARRLDPSLALYSRLLGAIELAAGRPDAAFEPLQASLAVNPRDDLAWRLLALVHDAHHEVDASRRAIDAALNLQRSDPTNLLLQARISDGAAYEEAIAELVQTWPHLLFAPGWTDFARVPDDVALGLAVARWVREPQTADREVDQPLVLVALDGRDDLADAAAAASPLSPEMARATMAVAGCDPGAEAALDRVTDGDRRTSLYWALRLVASDPRSADHERALLLYQAMTGRTLEERARGSNLSPLGENGLAGFSLDEWGYRRSRFPRLEAAFTLPSPSVGRVRWLTASPCGP